MILIHKIIPLSHHIFFKSLANSLFFLEEDVKLLANQRLQLNVVCDQAGGIFQHHSYAISHITG